MISKKLLLAFVLLSMFFAKAQSISDQNMPTLKLIGGDISREASNDPYIELGATAIDQEEGDITHRISIGGDTVYPNYEGIYTVSYNVTDRAGNRGIEITRTVTIMPDVTPPFIKLNGEEFVFLELGQAYEELGAIVYDNLSKSLTTVISGDFVNTNALGNYKVNYDVEDDYGNKANTLSRTILVTTNIKQMVFDIVNQNKDVKDALLKDLITEEVCGTCVADDKKKTATSSKKSIRTQPTNTKTTRLNPTKKTFQKNAVDNKTKERSNTSTKSNNISTKKDSSQSEKTVYNANGSTSIKVASVKKNNTSKASVDDDTISTNKNLAVSDTSKRVLKTSQNALDVVKKKTAIVTQQSNSYLSSSSQNAVIKTLSLATSYKAGSIIELTFLNPKKSIPFLYCSNSYGTTLVLPNQKKDTLKYLIPTFISNKLGVVNWKLATEKTPLQGSFYVHSKDSVTSMESYIGPPTINAGGDDHTMLVVIPTETLDNPIKRKTLVVTKHQFLNTNRQENIYTNNLIAYTRVYSEEKTGRFLIASESMGKNSKEFTIDAVPRAPKNFKIFFTRAHDYADGNQITTFSTTVLKDTYGNTINDGLYVTFYIKNKKNDILSTSGTTISGVATAKMIHPDYEENWIVKAYIDGIAESNSLKIPYKAVVQDYEIVFSEKNRKITVGPLQSFMNQIIPDGLQVKLAVYKNNILVKEYINSSNNGFANFNLKTDIIPSGVYEIRIESAGIKKIIQDKII